MKVSSALALLLPAVAARFVESLEADTVQLRPEEVASEQFLVQLGPDETRWVTEDEKWELRRVRFSFASDASFESY